MTDRENIRITHLLEVLQLVPALVEWFVREWERWYGAGGQGDAAQDRSLPQPRHHSALSRCSDLLGTAALRAVGSELGVGPWLTGVLVSPQHRGKGVGTEAGIIDHLVKYATPERAAALKKIGRISDTKYNWSLNE